MSANAGRILLIPKGAYDSDAAYEMLDVVYHNNNTFICKKPCSNIEPADGEFWMKALEQLPVVDDLNSNDATKALSAKQGKNLDAEVMDLKMLGWTVPKEMPIKNSEGNGMFHQKVGRVDLGSLPDSSFRYIASLANDGIFPFAVPNRKYTNLQSASSYCKDYKVQFSTSSWAMNDKEILVRNDVEEMRIKDATCKTVAEIKAKLKGVYLYYELAQEITISIDGNEATTNQMLSDEWNVATTYAQGKFAIYKNKLWKSKVDNNVGNIPAEGTYWEFTNIGNSLNTLNALHYKQFVATDSTGFTVGTPNRIGAYKIGRVCNLNINIRGTITTTNTFLPIATLDSIYRPNEDIIHSICTQDGKFGLLFIEASTGIVKALSTTTISNSWVMRECVSYIGKA